MVGQPCGSVTFLFTDIEGSTRLLREMGGERYREALAKHRRQLRGAFTRHQGYEVDYEGDAFIVAFQSAAAGVAAAAEAQRALACGPIRVRMGLHTGVPLLDPPKYVGIEVHRAARIMSLGHGGQVLISRATRDLVVADVLELGEYRLKDFDDPITLYQLGAGRFPALRVAAELPRIALREMRKVVTIVAADVVEPSDGDAVDPESLRAARERCRDLAAEAVTAHGGVLEARDGDAITAVFGVPVVHEDDVMRATRAAWDLRQRIELVNSDLGRFGSEGFDLQAGISTGEVIASDIGDSGRLVTGRVPDAARVLANSGAPGEILLADDSYRLLGNAVTAERLEIPLRGRAPSAVWRLTQVREIGRSSEAKEPFIGREIEIAGVIEALSRVEREQTAWLLTLVGAAGVGKSRLASEVGQALASKASVLFGRCLPYGEGITFWPLAEMVQAVAGERSAKAITALLPGEEGDERVAELVAAAIGAGDAVSSSQETFAAIRRLLASLARGGPLVAVVDDLHWAEPMLLDLLDHIADWSRDSPILLLCLARREFLDDHPGWGDGKPNATTLQLEPLTDSETADLIDDLGAGAALSAELRERVMRAAEGNPLFVEQLVAAVAEDEGEFDVRLPPTIHALLAARLDRLPTSTLR